MKSLEAQNLWIIVQSELSIVIGAVKHIDKELSSQRMHQEQKYD